MRSDGEATSIRDLSIVSFVNTFSVMVVLGSVSTAYFFVQYFHAVVPLSLYWIIGSGVWIIYTSDHLLDGLRLKDDAIFLRHAIHYQYRQILIPTVCAIALFDVYVVIQFFPWWMLENGLILLGMVAIYFVLFWRWKTGLAGTVKEVFIAVMVAVGMIVYPGLCGQLSWALTDLAIIALFAVINYANLLIFTYFDHEGDQTNQLLSGSGIIGPDRIRGRIYSMLTLAFTLLTLYAFFGKADLKISATISVLVMLNILLLTLQFEERFRDQEWFRFWGDFIYVVPTPIWLFMNEVSLF